MAITDVDEGARATLDVREIYERWIATFASLDPERIAALCTEDSVLDVHVGGAPAVGRAALVEAYRRVFGQWPQFGFEAERTFFGPDHWVLDWYMTAAVSTASGDVVPVRMRSLDIVHLAPDGLVAHKDSYFDLADVERVRGALFG